VGSRWLTFVGDALLKQVGGAKRIEGTLAKTGVTLATAGAGVVLRAGLEPRPDPDPKSTKALRAVARTLEPITFFGDPLLEFEYYSRTKKYWDDQTGKERAAAHLAWERRFL
jgi:hypothetical protein